MLAKYSAQLLKIICVQHALVWYQHIEYTVALSMAYKQVWYTGLLTKVSPSIELIFKNLLNSAFGKVWLNSIVYIEPEMLNVYLLYQV